MRGDKDHRQALGRLQLAKLNRGLAGLRRRNGFYRPKLAGVRLPLESLGELASIPFTCKEELVRNQEQHAPFGTNLTSPLSRYTRIHTTSGTSGRPLKWLDTRRTWAWWLHCWREIYRAAGVNRDDVVFVAFGFGPFIGFWSGFEAAQILGAMVVAGGAQSSLQRLDRILETRATVLLSTPTYALRLAEVARDNGIDLATSSIRLTIHAGEPGASIPATRHRIEQAWGARCFDHAGLTEVGAWGFECPRGSGMHLLETEFVGEVLRSGSNEVVHSGETGELVLTNLGRWDMPVVRYRTGDIVRLQTEPCPCGRPYVFFPRGVIGRTDDLIQVRGTNVYPSVVEDLIRAQREVTEFEVEVFRHREMLELEVRLELEDDRNAAAITETLARELERHLGFRTTVRHAPSGSLPRYELKARRFKIRDNGG